MTTISIGSPRGKEIPAGADLETSRAWLQIDLGIFRQNLHRVRQQLAPGTELWAVVKANAYGHGARPIAKQALTSGAAGVCVATLREGIELRSGGILGPILILGPLNTEAELEQALRWDLEITLTRADQIPMLQRINRIRHQPIPIHLNVDTGMSRLGVSWREAAQIWQILCSCPELDPRSLYSHLATADQIDPSLMDQQQQRFSQLLQEIQDRDLPLPPLHLDNSAGIWTHRSGHYQRVRAGLAIYGLSPAPHIDMGDLQPILRLKARITHLQTVPPDTGVSYGYSYITSQTTRIATVGIGYADGVPRSLSNRLQGTVRNQRIPQIGTITMDQCMWDVTEIPKVEIGEPVELIGGDLTVHTWADALGTIPYEILCGFSARLPRICVGV